ncbi:hypothetical protein PUN28_003999 [Cardiocondyla obscurior]|uniref:Uncharacterized protein n=1 Tax=Cardiocondyla obscurior TaxID=286306 RepID=A0AAW2GPD1_9HYME
MPLPLYSIEALNHPSHPISGSLHDVGLLLELYSSPLLWIDGAPDRCSQLRNTEHTKLAFASCENSARI